MAVKRKSPFASVTSVRVAAVRSLVAVTVAPGITCPCWSCTEPEIEPVTSWAIAAPASAATSTAAPATRKNVGIDMGPSLSLLKSQFLWRGIERGLAHGMVLSLVTRRSTSPPPPPGRRGRCSNLLELQLHRQLDLALGRP